MSSIQNRYGKDGVNSIQVLESAGIEVTEQGKEITLHTAGLTTEKVQSLLAQVKYQGWIPEVKEREEHFVLTFHCKQSPVDEEALKRAALALIRSVNQGLGKTSPEYRLEPEKPLTSDPREKIAQELMRQLQQIGIDVKGKRCLDVGCRSAENTRALLDAGAFSVTGLDPDDSEFPKHNKFPLIKCRLQDYQTEAKYDLITIFLWGFPDSETEEVVRILRNRLYPTGLVVIGCFDQIYQKRLPPVLERHFRKVEQFHFPAQVNRYLIKGVL